jgi:sterol desaturase/sphingolipid hydroxylase (fatty acid hydroxylase superfamily)
MALETLFGALTPVTFFGMLLLERFLPKSRPQPKVRYWALKCFVLFFVCAALAACVPAVMAMVLKGHTPIDLSAAPLAASAVLAFLAGDLVNYFAHRLMHNVPMLWRWTHQMHHSAERVDLLGANYIHPFDLVFQVTATTIPVFVFGISPDAAAIAGYIGFVWGMFCHLDIRTPQWMGYVIQRPEAHAVHHTRGVHAYNYGNFPLWDILLGTFRNPVRCDEPAGFWDGASTRLGAMLIGRDVSTPNDTTTANRRSA